MQTNIYFIYFHQKRLKTVNSLIKNRFFAAFFYLIIYHTSATKAIFQSSGNDQCPTLKMFNMKKENLALVPQVAKNCIQKF